MSYVSFIEISWVVLGCSEAGPPVVLDSVRWFHFSWDVVYLSLRVRFNSIGWLDSTTINLNKAHLLHDIYFGNRDKKLSFSF